MSLKPTCKEVHQLTSESMDRKLSWSERVRVRLHLMVCDACRHFTGQMAFIRRAMRQLSSGADKGPDRESP